MSTLTRSEGDKLIHYDDCSPKTGNHKSYRHEIYRCEGGDDKVGVMAYTEANSNTHYECGFQNWWAVLSAEDLMTYHNNQYPFFTVSVLCFVLTASVRNNYYFRDIIVVYGHLHVNNHFITIFSHYFNDYFEHCPRLCYLLT